MSSVINIAANWEALSDVQGRKWSGLRDPMDRSLRRYLIHYGTMLDAFGASYDTATALSVYPKEQMLSNACIQKGNMFKYQITKLIYSRSEFKLADWEQDSWGGFVAVSTEDGDAALGRKDVLVCWRGAMEKIEQFTNLEFRTVTAEDLFGAASDGDDVPKVHFGFHGGYTNSSPDSIYTNKSARHQVWEEVQRLVDLYADRNVSITVTGHSLGSAFATLTAMDIVANGINKPSSSKSSSSPKGFPVTCFAFGAPRVGDSGFLKVFNKLSTDNVLRLLRVRNVRDPVTVIPPHGPLFDYQHVGEVIDIDSDASCFLKPSGIGRDLSNPHDLLQYLHTIAGYKGGKGDEFKLVIDLDISLINKYASGLKEDCNVPACWWPNKDLKDSTTVQLDNGYWQFNGFVPNPPAGNPA